MVRTQCWAELDQYLMTEVVPWVPYMFVNHVQVVSERVVAYSFDQFGGARRWTGSPSPPAPTRRAAGTMTGS